MKFFDAFIKANWFAANLSENGEEHSPIESLDPKTQRTACIVRSVGFTIFAAILAVVATVMFSLGGLLIIAGVLFAVMALLVAAAVVGEIVDYVRYVRRIQSK